MDQSLKTKWTEALRSGKHIQGKDVKDAVEIILKETL